MPLSSPTIARKRVTGAFDRGSTSSGGGFMLLVMAVGVLAFQLLGALLPYS